MRKLSFISLLSLIFIFGACTKEMNLKQMDTTSAIEQAQLSSSSVSSVLEINRLKETIDPEALEYYECVKTIMYATNALSGDNLHVDSDALPAPSDNLISRKLASLEIEDENGNMLTISNLPKEQQIIFTELLFASEAKEMSLKLAAQPSLRTYVRHENAVLDYLIKRENILKLKIGEVNFQQDMHMVDSKNFFKRLTDLYEQEENNASTIPSTQAIIGNYPYQKISVERVRAGWEEFSRKGRFIVALPDSYRPWVFFNMGRDVRFRVGHAAIFNEHVGSWKSPTDKTTIECFPENGVQYYSLSDWYVPHYIMGVQRIKWRWKWAWFRSRLIREKERINYPDKLAERAAGYVGRQYVRAYEFFTPKWAAPARFTCTTLVWYSAKKAYDINVSTWASPIVTPQGLYLDDCTYIVHYVY